MRFVFRMVAREVRASWARLLFFFVCVAIGVGAVVAIRSVVQTVHAGLASEARALLSADVLVSTNRPWDEDTRRTIERRLSAVKVLGRAETVETATMVRTIGVERESVRMVELEAVDAAFPLRGRVTLQGGGRYSHELVRGRGALVRPELLAQLDLAVGDRIAIGDAQFTIRGVVLTEPGRRLGLFSLGPRVIIDRADMAATGLLRFGSRARYVLMLNLDERDIERVVTTVRSDFTQRFVNVRSYRGTEDDVGEDFQRAENYLSLVGFVMVVLGGIGVWSVTRVFVQQKIRAIAVLKCLGATTPQVLSVYVIEVLLLALAGSALGVLMAGIGLQAVPVTAMASVGGVAPGLTASAVAQGAGIGVLVSLLFSLVPLLDIRHVRPLLLLRDQGVADADHASREPAGARSRGGFVARLLAGVRSRVGRVDRLRAGVAVAVSMALVVLASWQAASIEVGLLVCAAFVALAALLHVAGGALIRAVRPLRHVGWFPLRHAVISVGRPGNQTRVILLAVGLGAFFILGIRALQINLTRELAFDLASGGADLFLIDIQRDQVDGVERLLARTNPERPTRFVPVLRARVTGVTGRTLNLEGFEDVRGRGSLAREYVITYRPRLEANETVVAGRFWSPTAANEAEVSIEESLRDRFGIDLGDRVRFDVLGRIIEARVTSVRRVDWSDARSGGFMFVFRPGVLERAPHTYIAITRGPDDAAGRGRLQRDLVTAFSNVSVIDVREVARTVQGILGQVTFAISTVGAVALFSGLLILVGSVAMTKFQRLHEAAVFKTLGASTRTMTLMLAIEYTTLGLLAGAVGAVGAIGLSWVISRRVLDIAWHPAPAVSAVGMIATAAIVGLLGVVSSLDVLRRKPLAILRAE